jgi:hypothetical protein
MTILPPLMKYIDVQQLGAGSYVCRREAGWMSTEVFFIWTLDLRAEMSHYRPLLSQSGGINQLYWSSIDISVDCPGKPYQYLDDIISKWLYSPGTAHNCCSPLMLPSHLLSRMPITSSLRMNAPNLRINGKGSVSQLTTCDTPCAGLSLGHIHR